jgi:hypothetical protein
MLISAFEIWHKYKRVLYWMNITKGFDFKSKIYNHNTVIESLEWMVG